MHYLITYDLADPAGPAKRDYAPLESRLKEHQARRILYSVWIVDTAWTHTQLRDDLKRFVLAKDRLLVTGIVAPAAWVNLQISDADFLQFMQ